jgi:hypothetical protein
MKSDVERKYEMSISREDFMRQLPDVFEDVPYEVSGNEINAKWPNRSLTIRLSPEGEKEMGSLDLPFMTATFDFDGFSDEERIEFLDRVQQHYQKGAGGP